MNVTRTMSIAAGQSGKEQQYWLNQFSGPWEKSHFPYDFEVMATGEESGGQAAVGTGKGIVKFEIEGELFTRMMRLSSGSDSRLHMICITAAVVLLHRWTGNNDIIIGIPVDKQDIEGQLINTALALRNRVESHMSFKELLLEVRKTILEAAENQNYPIEVLLYDLELTASETGFPLFDVVVLLENIQDKQYLRDIHVNTIFSLLRTERGIEGELEYNSRLIHESGAARLSKHFCQVLDRVLADVNVRVGDIDILLPGERRALLEDFNNTFREYSGVRVLHGLFEEQVERTPDRTAVIGRALGGGYRLLTYKSLNQRSNELAYILKQRGVGSGVIVGIMVENPVELAAGILGILKAGGAYLPFSFRYPEERVVYMLRDSRAGFFIKQGNPGPGVMEIPGLEVLNINDFPGGSDSLSNLLLFFRSSEAAYIIYTSGTTGEPRGVVVEHGSAVNTLVCRKEEYELGVGVRALQLFSPAFDGFVTSFFSHLVAGAGIVLLSEDEVMDISRVKKVIIENSVTHFISIPSLYRAIIEELTPGELSSLSVVTLAGDRVAPRLLEMTVEKKSGLEIAQEYGVTEAAVMSTLYRHQEKEARLKIGSPIWNTGIYIIDNNTKSQPLGVPGELCIAGLGLARGYLNKPGLTFERFINYKLQNTNYKQLTNHKSQITNRSAVKTMPGEVTKQLNEKLLRGVQGGSFLEKSPPGRRRQVIYRTGDLARWQEDGNIEFIGRKDYQVKIMGFRIELGEIESRLSRHDQVKEAIVIDREAANGRKYLCSYIVPCSPGSLPGETQLRDFLGRLLPDYMIPAYFLILERLPLTSIGKIDRKKLPPPEELVDIQYAAPGNELERRLAEIWQSELNQAQVGINDNYFNIGGDSIKSVRLINIINSQLNTQLKIADLYVNNSIARLAAWIEQNETVDSLTDGKYEKAQVHLAGVKSRYLRGMDKRAIGLSEEDIEDIYPMSHIEIGMVYYTLMNPGTGVYHNQIIFRRSFRDFDPGLLKRAMLLLLEKHPVLRTVFDLDSPGEPVQIVLRSIPVDIEHFDIAHLEAAEQEDFIRTRISGDREKIFEFDLKGITPLWRTRTFLVEEDLIYFLWSCHHAILDGWSSASLMTELNNTYLELKSNLDFVPVKLGGSYRDFVIDQVIEKEERTAREFWRKELAGYQRLEFPGTPGLAGVGSESVPRKAYSMDLGQAMAEKLAGMAVRYDTSLKHLCFAAYIYMLNMFSYESDIVAGLVTSSRPTCEDGDKIIGCFLNTVPVRVRIPVDICWGDYIRLVDRKLVELATYDHLSLFEIVRLTGEKAEHRNPLFDTFFNFIDFHVYREFNPGESGESGESEKSEERVPGRFPGKRQLSVTTQSYTNTLLDFGISPGGGGLSVGLSYSDVALSDQMVERCIGYFERVLEKFLREPGSIIVKDDLLFSEDKQGLLYEFNDTGVTYFGNHTIHELFSQQVEGNRDAIALVGEGILLSGSEPVKEVMHVTYRELSRKSDALAGSLMGRGVRPGVVVAIMVERSLEMILGILGILKAGGAYMPVEPDYPEDRINYMLGDSSAAILLTGRETALLSLPVESDVIPGDVPPVGHLLAYVIYTSGSTGWPRGVMVEHLPVINILFALQEAYPLLAADAYLLKTPYIFDVSVAELFGWYMGGGRLAVLEPGGEKDPEAILAAIKRNRVTHINFVPSMFHVFAAGLSGENVHMLAGLRYIFLAGEALQPQTVKSFEELNTDVLLENIYGPTEGTVYTSRYSLSRGLRGGKVPIGKPMANIRLYILDSYGALQSPGIVGELHIAGAGLARGYLNRPELTLERFVNYKLQITDEGAGKLHNQKLLQGVQGGGFLEKSPPGRRRQGQYKTGDLSRWLEDGNIEFLGRIDHQVKIRGFRIELGEIESRIRDHKKIKDVVVITREIELENIHICAYIVLSEAGEGKPGEVLAVELKSYLSRWLPGYMIPVYFVELEQIPLTPGGKVDRGALPQPELEASRDYTGPANELETRLLDIWAEVLGIEKDIIGMNDNFFALGGHSLRATILAARIHKEFDIKLPLAVLFKTPRIRGLARYIRNREKQEYMAIQPGETKEYYPLSPAQQRLYFLRNLVSDNTGYNMPHVIPLQEGIDRDKLETVFRILIRRHESLRTSFGLVSEKPVQRIHREVDFSIGYDESKEHDQEKMILNYIRPFDLSRAPLLRVLVIDVPLLSSSPGNSCGQVLYIDMHHIVTDGTSLDILEREFMELYSKIGDRLEISPLKLQYRDYSGWQNRKEQQELIKQEESYWLAEFRGELPVLNLPFDHPRPLMQSFAGNQVQFSLDVEETGILKQIAEAHDVTLYMVLLALLNILLSKLGSGGSREGEDIVIGTPIAARRHADLQGMVGMLVNTLAMRNYPAGHKSFEEFLAEVKHRTLEAYENQEYPFEMLVEKLGLHRDTSRNPVFDVMLNLLNQGEFHGESPEVASQPPYRHKESRARFDLVFHALDLGSCLTFILEYSNRLFVPGTIDGFISYFKTIIKSLAGNSRQRLADLHWISAKDRQEILRFSNGDEEEPVKHRTIHHWFEEKAGEIPGRTALVMEDRHMSFGELNCKANQMARILREKGVGVDTVVGVMVDRSLEMIAAVLAVLKAGAAYLPIDPRYPEQRVLTVLNDSQVPLLLTTANQLDRFSVMGLKNMKAKGKNLVITPGRESIKDFDILPYPDRTLVDYETYHRSIGIAMAKHTVSLQATRGCPYNCAYCHKIWPKTQVARSAGNILGEMQACYRAGVRRFVFIDDIFNLDKTKSSRLFQEIIKQFGDIQLFFPNGLRGDILSMDFIDLMMEAGTVNMDLALESASPRIQRLIGKKLNLEKFAENVRYITEKYPRVLLEMELMIGFPGETQEEALMTLEFLEQLKWVHFPNLNILKIYPNTDMYRLALANGVSAESIRRSADLAYHELPETLPFSKQFVREYQTRFMNRYFLSKKRLSDVLPLQVQVLTEDELVQKYDSYLPAEIKEFRDILEFAGISGEVSGWLEFLPPGHMAAPGFNEKIKPHFSTPGLHTEPPGKPLRVLLLDLSLFFSREAQGGKMLYDMIEEPLGLMYLLSYIDKKFPGQVCGKIAKSRIDFDSYEELKSLVFEFQPDLIGLRTLSFYKEFFHRTVLLMRQWGVTAPLVVGGPYATSDFRLILEDSHIDLVVLGEGEMTFSRLVENMLANENKLPDQEILTDIPGLAFVNRNDNNREERRNQREILLVDEMFGRLEQYSGENPDHSTGAANNLVYTIFTSGSTGNPKGVMLEHGNLVNLLQHEYRHTGIDFSRVLQFTTLSFDVSFQEIFSTLAAGGVLFLIDGETLRSVPRLFGLIEKNRIKTLFLPASYVKFILDRENHTRLIPASVRHIVSAGEQAVIHDNFRSYLQAGGVYFHNHYGPSETHVVTELCLEPAGDIPGLPLIGKPLINTSIYILDRSGHLIPAGIGGEMYIGGIQVGRGYLNRPELTAEKYEIFHHHNPTKDPNQKFCGGPGGGFLKEPPGRRRQRLYRTGDLACWNRNGDIRFLGRIDHQVKVRGFRVEPGEIEAHILGSGEVKDAAVVVKTDTGGDARLCAYVVGRAGGGGIDAVGLKKHLQEQLPDYMVPTYFIEMQRIPLTPNGKVDRKALPEPGVVPGEKSAAPRDEIERRLVEIWAEILGLGEEKIGIEDNFFDLGGHSLKLITLVSRVHKEFGINIPITQVFERPIIREISEGIKSNHYIEKPVVIFKASAGKDEDRGVFCFPPGTAHGISYQALASAINDYSFYSFNFIEAENRLSQYLETITGIQPQGPYIFLGWSAGGTLAFEVAAALEQRGEVVSDIILADCVWQGGGGNTVFEVRFSAEFVRQVEEILEGMGLEFLKEKVLEKVKRYMTYLTHLQHLEKVNANVHYIFSGEAGVTADENRASFWSKLTTRQLVAYNGFGDHFSMFDPGPVEKNAGIVRGILGGISPFSGP